MPEDKYYPRMFVCGNPACKRVLGVVNRSNQRIVSLYVLRDPLPCGTNIDDVQLTRMDFAVMSLGFGDIPCRCGYVTTWHWNNQMLSRLTKGIRKDV